MKSLILAYLLLISAHAHSQASGPKISPAPEKGSKASAKKLIQSLLSMGQASAIKSASEFRVDNCKGSAKDWLNLLMTGKSFTAKYKFRKACDSEGTWSPRLDAYFPAKFKLKNLDSFKQTDFQILINFEKSFTPKITYTIKKGRLASPKNTIEFSAKYTMVADLAKSLAAQKVVPQSHKGHIHFTKMNGAKVDIKEPITIKY